MQERPTGKNLPVYASLSTMRQEPSQSEMNNGVIPLDTLPAAWWNWMWNAITQAQNDSMYNDDVLFTEINNVLTEAGITPGTSSNHDQLRQAINVIKGAIATTAEVGSVLSTDSGTTGTVKVAADGRMTVNNFGDIASFHGASKDNLMGALNETYDIAYGSNDSVGELSSLTTTAKDTLVTAINELDAGKAPTMHASTETTYGIGNAGNYGHVKLTDTPGYADAASGTAATPKLVHDMVSGGLGAINAVSYTFVVDSNDKLTQWANNNKSSGQDYTSVLIRKGEWTNTKGVNLTSAGTKVVVGEPGSKLVFNGVDKGLYYDRVPTTTDYYMQGVTATTSGSTNGYGFYSCNNLTNCSAIASGSTSGSGFYRCNNLTNCSATGTGTTGYGFYRCNNLTNCTGSATGTTTGYGFYSCKNLTNCAATAAGTGRGEGYGFYVCNNLTNCTGSAAGIATGYSFYGCNNLTNCAATADDSASGIGFYGCNKLTNCTANATGTANGYGFYDCNNLTNCTGSAAGIATADDSANGIGFYDCNNLTNCAATAIGTGRGEGYGFYSCYRVILSKAGGHCTTAAFTSCYVSSTVNSTYACADTPNGGFNNTTNPRA